MEPPTFYDVCTLLLSENVEFPDLDQVKLESLRAALNHAKELLKSHAITKHYGFEQEYHDDRVKDLTPSQLLDMFVSKLQDPFMFRLDNYDDSQKLEILVPTLENFYFANVTAGKRRRNSKRRLSQKRRTFRRSRRQRLSRRH